LPPAMNPVALLAAWADELGRRMGARLPGAADRLVYLVLLLRHEHRPGRARQPGPLRDQDLPLDVIMIDDGYETQIGDWLAPSDRFPDRLAPVARSVKAAGKIPACG